MAAAICLFCPNPLNAGTKPEHILLNALGGRRTSRDLICSECNNLFGSGIDAKVANQVGTFRNHLQLPSGDGKPPPMLKRLRAGDEVVTIRNDGRPELVQPPFVIKDDGEGKATVQFTLRSPEELPRAFENVAAKLRQPVEHLVEKMEINGAVIGRKRAGTIHFSLQFGGTDFLRSIAKSCLELWATNVGNDEVRGDAYEAARNFVVVGGDDFNHSRTAIDSRYPEDVERLIATYGPVFNLLYVRSDRRGRVVGHFTLYNLLGWQIVLAEAGGSPNLRIGLVSNALDPSKWSGNIAEDIDIPMEWLQQPQYDPTFESQQDRIAAALQVGHDRAVDREIGRIVEEEFGKHLSDEPKVPDEAIVNEISARIADRVAGLLLDIPHEERLDPETVHALLASVTRRSTQ